jgi:hypothetical protein
MLMTQRIDAFRPVQLSLSSITLINLPNCVLLRARVLIENYNLIKVVYLLVHLELSSIQILINASQFVHSQPLLMNNYSVIHL